MALPTAYTEGELKAYMHSTLGAVAIALGWTVAAGDYDQAVSITLRACGVSDIANALDMVKLETLARREAWAAAMRETAGDYDYSADGATYDRSQMHEQIKAQYELAVADALSYDDSYTVGEGTIEWDWTPYRREEVV